MKTIQKEIVDSAYKYLGEEEIRGNLGFKSEEFQTLLSACGWKKGQAWCSYFVELVWRMAYAKQNSLIENEITPVFSGGAVNTFSNFKKYDGKLIDTHPSVGSIVIWQYYKNGKPHWSGHAGIVVKLNENSFTTIEGNTNDDGVREGYEVAERIRILDYGRKAGLVVKGFIKPIQI